MLTARTGLAVFACGVLVCIGHYAQADCENGCDSSQIWSKYDSFSGFTFCWSYTKPQAKTGHGAGMQDGAAITDTADPANGYRSKSTNSGSCTCECSLSGGYWTVCTDATGDFGDLNEVTRTKCSISE